MTVCTSLLHKEQLVRSRATWYEYGEKSIEFEFGELSQKEKRHKETKHRKWQKYVKS